MSRRDGVPFCLGRLGRLRYCAGGPSAAGLLRLIYEPRAEAGNHLDGPADNRQCGLMADIERDLIDAVLTTFAPENEGHRRQVGQLSAALGTISAEEARQLYRVANEKPELPDQERDLDFLRIPFLLFGPRFVIDVVEGLRAGSQEVPIRELVIEPFEDV